MRKMLILIPPLGLAESLGFSYERYALRQVGEVTGLEDRFYPSTLYSTIPIYMSLLDSGDICLRGR